MTHTPDFTPQTWQQDAAKRVHALVAARRPTYTVTTYGCQMNARDSQTLAGLLAAMGFTAAPSGSVADLVLLNTCCVRAHAEERVFGNLGVLRQLKDQNPHMVIGVCGCMMQQPHMAKKVRARFPHVDMVFGPSALPRFCNLLLQVLERRERVMDIREDNTVTEGMPAARENLASAFVNVMYGCDNFCSYCVVPYVRGRERSRTPQSILDEVRALAAAGCLEVTLLGQNVNSYGQNLPGAPTFAQLLRDVSAVPGIRRVRFMTSHPKDVTPALIDAMAACDNVARHIHLPVQSGSDAILAAMNRKYTRTHYLTLVDNLRAALPDIELTTDIIVGFPGETDADFADTLDLVRRVGFCAAYTFLYSKRQGTRAATMERQVAADTARARLAQLNAEVQRRIVADAPGYLGKTLTVLVEGSRPEKQNLLYGRTQGTRMIHFPGREEWIGTLMDVKIEQVRDSFLLGSPCFPPQ